jgi:hypothetical protein
MVGVSMTEATLASNQTRYGLVYVFPETEGEKQQSTVYAIVGSVIGVIIAIIILFLLVRWILRKSKDTVPIVLTAPMAPMAQMVPTAPIAPVPR